MTEVDTKDVVLESFHDFWRAWRDESYTYYVTKGGRNSGKSTSISERFILDLIELPINGLCIRKVYDTIQGSMYEQLKAAISLLGVDEYFAFAKAPLRITYIPRGNYIVFRGADDPQKMKSIKTANFPIARAWIEELTEFKLEEELQVITDSILRAELPEGLTYKIAYSYNPPKRKQHWVNKKYESHVIPANTFVHNSCYLDNPYLSAQTVAEINAVKATSEKKYRWIYLGEPSGGGVVPFDNLSFRRITDEETEHFDNIRQGLDWGYAVDPAAFIRLHYDKTRRRIFFLDEIYGVKMSNREMAEEIKKRGYGERQTIADSAEPKSISELRDYGVKISGATKGEGSVEYGEKWLDDLSEIVIDPTRTPNIAREFENIDYQVDKDGNLKAKLEDKDNHCFVGDTLIDTMSGPRPIKGVEVGDLVLTSKGYRHVVRKFDNGVQVVRRYSLRIGSRVIVLSATPKHLIRTGETWTQIAALQPGQTVCLSRSSTEKHTAYTPANAISPADVSAYTSQFGNTSTARFLPATMSTIRTKTLGTIGPTILRLCQRASTRLGMAAEEFSMIRDGLSASILTALNPQRLGMLPMLATNGTLNTGSELPPSHSKPLRMSASNAAGNTPIAQPTLRESSATQTARLAHFEQGEEWNERVYDLRIEGEHEYFANGVLVHNCIDATRYACESDMGRSGLRFLTNQGERQ